MIPRIIHYCWFGKAEKPEFIKKCMESWKEHLPNYEMIEWNEDSFDISANQYAKQAYDRRRWAFVSDYARLWALYNYGGIYLDTDVEVLKSLDPFLNDRVFTGFESVDCPITAVMGAEKDNQIVENLLNQYKNRTFVDSLGNEDCTTNTVVITDTFVANGIKPNGKEQSVNGLHIYPQVVFCPNNISRIWNKPSSKSYTIHHFDSSWKGTINKKRNLWFRIRRYLVGVLRNIVGTKRLEGIKNRLSKKR